MSQPPPLSAVALDGIPEVRAGDDLAALVAAALPSDLRAGDVLSIAHKVVSKAEGRTRRLSELEASERARDLAAEHGKDPRVVQAVLDESRTVLRAGHGVLICETHHGLICANAGVDRSNAAASDQLILLPEDPDASARRLRARIEILRGVRPAVVVTDSFGRAWRLGQTDVAIGAAGLSPLDDWRGRRDARGRELHATAIAVADAIAAAADLARAKDADQPAVLLRGLDRFVTADDGPGAISLRRPPADDLFR
ncbi:MAG TPA: coenzyme F420-0:L-glutamate ligase [Thermoleophilaceae bacterium]|nr:coenzyme F420-0:L-glutamate ligase [Thermoleophilaceae bacterium]